MRPIKLFVAALFLAFAFSCQTAPPIKQMGDVITASGTAEDQALAYNASAVTAATEAQKHADPTGKSLIDLAVKAINASTKSVGAAKALGVTLAELVKQTGIELQNEKDALYSATHSWGYIAGQWVNRIFWWLVAMIVAHYILGFASIVLLFFPPWGTAASKVCATAANIVNPLGWVSWLVSHIQTKAPGVTVVPTSTSAPTPVNQLMQAAISKLKPA